MQGGNEVKDTAYLERANGRWEAWTYSEGRKYYLRLPGGGTRASAITYLERRHFNVVVVK